eukprot:scaffold1315_cov405-Prasinococcus_capsulatus_cf.AAC.2
MLTTNRRTPVTDAAVAPLTQSSEKPTRTRTGPNVLKRASLLREAHVVQASAAGTALSSSRYSPINYGPDSRWTSHYSLSSSELS